MNEKAPDGSPSPKICTMRISNANDGSALPTFDTLTATTPPLRTCPIRKPIGSAISAATAIETIEIWTCSRHAMDHTVVPAPVRPVAEPVPDVTEEAHA